MTVNELQTILETIRNIKPDVGSQDALAIAAAEYSLSQSILKVAEARFKQAKEILVEFPEVSHMMDGLRGNATQIMMPVTDNIVVPRFIIGIQARTPPMTVDTKSLINNLIKAGVSQETIENARNVSTKKGTSACLITITPVGDEE
jgi:hypothetical protein